MIISKENLSTAKDILKPHRKKLGLLFFLTAIQAVMFSAVDPLAMKFLIDALSEGDVQTFIYLAVGVTFIATFGRALIYYTALTSQKIKNDVHQHLTVEMAESIYNKPYAEIADKGRGYFTSRLHDEARQLSGVVDVCTGLISGALVSVIGLSVAIWLSWEITLALVVIVPFLYFLAHRFSGRISNCTERLHETEAQFKSILNKAIDSFKYVKTHSLINQAQHRIEEGIAEPLDARYKNTKIAAMYQSISSVFLSYAELSVLIAAGIQVILGVFTIGSLFALTRAFGMIVGAVQQLSAVIPQIAALNGLLERYRVFTQTVELPQVSTGTAEHNELELHNVGFSYGDKQILKDVSFNVNHEDKILISGGNGVGKSTFLNLLAGFYQPQQGRITLAQNKEMSSALYPFQFLPGTVKENFNTLSLKWNSSIRAEALIKELGLQECLDINYDDLSEGQKKKCQIAACLLKPANIYVLDEPLANIDDQSKESILGLIEQYTKNAAVLMIMHEGNTFKDKFTRFIDLKGDGKVAVS